MHVFVCSSVYEFRGQNSVKRGKNVKPGKNSHFLKKGKTVVSVRNWKFSRFRMMKQISPLNSSCEI